jgi:glycosyltransferase involved in cell wall biosynthesis
MRVAALTKYDREAASTRQRILQFAPSLAEHGIELRHYPLLDDAYVRSLATGGKWSRTALIGSYFRRLASLVKGLECDLIWVHLELFPYLPAGFEKLAFRSGIPVVYDCDDALFLRYNNNPSRALRALLSGKIEQLMSRAAAVTCGNAFLRDYAAAFCPNASIFPTVLDTDIYTPSDHKPAGTPVIGWIGSPSTWENVQPLLPVLEKLCGERGITFRAIGAGYKAEADRFAGMELAPWCEATEVAEVQGFDIGIMPLIDNPWQRGKSGYKLIQYMACAIAAIGSPVGANSAILAEDCGILARTDDEWESSLTRLLDDAALRQRMGAAGRSRAVEHYSLAVHAPRLRELFLSVARGAANSSR